MVIKTSNSFFKYIVVVPTETDEKGHINIDKFKPPYGYHHIVGCYADGSFKLLASIDVSYPCEMAIKIAETLGKHPVMVDKDFYRK